MKCDKCGAEISPEKIAKALGARGGKKSKTVLTPERLAKMAAGKKRKAESRRKAGQAKAMNKGKSLEKTIKERIMDEDSTPVMVVDARRSKPVAQEGGEVVLKVRKDPRAGARTLAEIKATLIDIGFANGATFTVIWVEA